MQATSWPTLLNGQVCFIDVVVTEGVTLLAKQQSVFKADFPQLKHFLILKVLVEKDKYL